MIFKTTEPDYADEFFRDVEGEKVTPGKFGERFTTLYKIYRRTYKDGRVTYVVQIMLTFVKEADTLEDILSYIRENEK